ncbi:MAG TPA: DUF1844 domain-containing protein [bacterium]|nr:DUF1844 domain-containing protein [bacterium]
MVEENNNTSSEIHGPRKVSFAEFLMLLSTQTMMQLGMIPNPFTKKSRVDLVGAQTTIEAIHMLRDKTKGNLTQEEAKMLDSALHNLQLRFVEVVQEAEKTQHKSEEKE